MDSASSRSEGAVPIAKFVGVDRPVRFEDAADVESVLKALLWGWRFQDREVEESGEPPSLAPLGVRREGAGYRISAPRRREDLTADTPVAAACSLLVDLVRAYAESQPRWSCLHCGAIEIDGRLVLLIGPSRAGKSTLIADFACRGIRVFTDDILPVDFAAGVGLSMGIPPRLRLPLPPAIQGAIIGEGDDGEGDRDRRGPSDERYLYLRPDTIAQATFGTTAPLGGLVFLDRRDDGRARATCMDPGAAFAELIVQTFSGSMLIEESVNQVAALVSSTLCMRLTYAASDHAVMTLLEALERDAAGVRLPESPSAAMACPEEMTNKRRTTGIDPVAQFRRIADANEVTVGMTVFVANAQHGSVHALNATARGMWALLAEPLSLREATAILQGAFPDTPPELVASDIDALFAQLIESGLIEPA